MRLMPPIRLRAECRAGADAGAGVDKNRAAPRPICFLCYAGRSVGNCPGSRVSNPERATMKLAGVLLASCLVYSVPVYAACTCACVATAKGGQALAVCDNPSEKPEPGLCPADKHCPMPGSAAEAEPATQEPKGCE